MSTNAEHTVVYRVTVRGQFKGLTEAAQALLAAGLADHDFLKSAFTAEGTFTYDANIRFFNLRYEIRATSTGVSPADVALDEAALFLSTLRLSHGPLRAAVMDMSAMTDRANGPT